MRVALGAVAAVALLVAPHAAAEVHPAGLVLRQTDMPAGFGLDEARSGVRSNSEESAGNPKLRRLIAQTGRVTGYEAEFDKGTDTIESRVDVHRQARGARILFAWYDRAAKLAGMTGLRRSRAGVGAESWLYTGPSPRVFVLVVWRYDRVVAGVVATGISKARTLALVRTQQQRIARALR